MTVAPNVCYPIAVGLALAPVGGQNRPYCGEQEGGGIQVHLPLAPTSPSSTIPFCRRVMMERLYMRILMAGSPTGFAGYLGQVTGYPRSCQRTP